MKTAVVRDEDGAVCDTPELQQQRWSRHFSQILNLQSVFDASEIAKVRQRKVRSDMADLPSKEELSSVLGKLKSGKAGGESSILLEMLKAACEEEEFMELLLELVEDVWRERRVPSDWCDAVLIPIPKKGDLSKCDNCRGIPCWMLWQKWWRGCYRSGCRRLRRSNSLNRSVASGRGGAVLT